MTRLALRLVGKLCQLGFEIGIARNTGKRIFRRIGNDHDLHPHGHSRHVQDRGLAFRVGCLPAIANQLCTAFVENEHRKVIYFGLSGQLILIIRVNPFVTADPAALTAMLNEATATFPLNDSSSLEQAVQHRSTARVERNMFDSFIIIMFIN